VRMCVLCRCCRCCCTDCFILGSPHSKTNKHSPPSQKKTLTQNRSSRCRRTRRACRRARRRARC
jgi:hypothetical protein